MMIVLPRHIRTTMLKSFWIVFSSITIALVTLFIYLITQSYISLLILVFIPVLIYPGFKSPDNIIKPYKSINWILFKIRGLVRKISLYIIHYQFFLSFKLSGKHNVMVLSKAPEESMWDMKSIVNLTGESGNHDVSFDQTDHNSWLRSYIKWIRRTGKWELLFVVPFILFISMTTDSRDSKSISHDTYTLY